ncbi:MAG: hypothetical protein HXY45_20855 [Syntrophaceae bacterium]|jgi:hypothetical protein|nr:hypothetical protein [Syntrophaceae bacterium]
MSPSLPEGTNLRKAVQWVSKTREEGKIPLPTLIDQACMRFNLSPKDADFLHRFFAEGAEDKK